MTPEEYKIKYQRERKNRNKKAWRARNLEHARMMERVYKKRSLKKKHEEIKRNIQ